MRIRGTKPEFYSSELIARIPWEYRFLLKGLESYVDDNGVGKDDLALIVGAICPRDMFANPRETVARVSEGVSVIHQAGMLWRYEADGLKLLYVSFFDSAQRIDKPNKGRYRRPDGTMEYRESVIGECFVEPSRGFATTSDTLAPVTEEQRNRGTEELVRTPVQTEQHSAPEPTSAAAATPGAELVRANIPKGHPSATLTALRIQASELVNTGTDPDTVAAALRLWCEKPGVGIGRTILSSLCSEVIKSRNAHQAPTQPHKLRVLANLAAKARDMEAEQERAIEA